MCHKAYFHIVKYYKIMNFISWYLGYLQTEENVMNTQLEITLKIKNSTAHKTVSDLLFHKATRQLKFCKTL